MLGVFLAAFHFLYLGVWLPEMGDIAGLASHPALRILYFGLANTGITGKLPHLPGF